MTVMISSTSVSPTASSLVLTLLAFLFALPVSAQVAVLEPVDEAADDPSFVIFRARLLEAVAARDTAFVLSVLDPDVKVSFGAENGVEGFRLLWLTGMRPPGDDLWSVLARTAALGSTYDGTPGNATASATTPYVFGAWPDSLDAFTHLAVVGENVRVRTAPSLGAETLTVLTYALVPTIYDPDLAADWKRITLSDGRAGYVAARFLRSPIDHRLGFTKTGGRWRIGFFVAGD